MRIKVRDGKTSPGETYNSWTVLGKEFYANKNWRVVCQCKCGKIAVVLVDNLLNEESKNCKVCRALKSLKSPEVKLGNLYGNLTVVSEPWYDQFRSCNKWRVKASCKCGWEGEVSSKLLLKGRDNHKGCKLYCQGRYHGSWKGCGDLSGKHWNKICYAAKERNIDVDISIEKAWEKYKEQNGSCILTGWGLSMGMNSNELTASLDRIDSSDNYTADNIQWVHKDVNRSKWYLSQQQYIDYCYLVNTFDSRFIEKLEIKISKRYKSFKGEGNLSLGFFNSIKDGSIRTRYGDSCNSRKRRKQRRLAFELSIKDAWKLYCEQGGRCALTGIPIYFGLVGYCSKPTYQCQPGEATASLDRIDSSKGYVLGNIQWVHKDLNLIKYSFSEIYFKEICDAVTKRNLPSSDVESLLLPANFSFEKRQQQNQWNSGPRNGNFKGVYKIKNGYACCIKYKNKTRFLGNFKSEVDAAKNYDYYALKFFSENTYLNYPKEDYSSFVPNRSIE